MFRDTGFAVSVATIAPLTPVPTRRPAYNMPPWWGNVRPEDQKYKSKTKLVVKSFVTGTLKGPILDQCSSGRHIYTTRKNGTELWLFKDNPSLKLRFCVARLVNGAFVGNASSLSAIRQVNGRIVPLNARAEKIQQALRDVMPMLPFQMLKDNGFMLESLEVLDRGVEETLKLRPRDERDSHFIGAMVFKITARSGRGKSKSADHFLFDIDRNDLKEGVFNPFLSKLPSPVRTIEEAYDLLKPQEVRDAERFLKSPCPRQGEWFFIPVVGDFEVKKVRDSWSGGPPRHAEAVLQSKGNRAHYVDKLSEEGYVKGKVRHGGHEHPPIKLETWHKPVPNSAIESFTVTGGVD